MEVALIPPFSELDLIKGRKFQMILPSNLKRASYRAAYHPEHMTDSFVLLDNGMFEGETMTNENLIELVDTWRVDEVVMPDVRDNHVRTLQAMEKFLRMWDMITLDKTPSLMAVVQVDDLAGTAAFISDVLDMEMNYSPTSPFTFGVPRRMVESFSTYARVHVVDCLATMAPRNPIHLLGYARTGCSPDTFCETQALSRRVRSIDTDAPWVWAHYGATFNDPTPYERPFNYPLSMLYPDGLVKANIETLDRWARGRA